MPTPVFRTFLVVVGFVLFLAGCGTTQDLETLFLPSRGPWQLVNSADNGHATIVEYVPQGQDLDSWREMITVEALDDRLPREAPRATAEKLREAMGRRGGKLEWSVIESDANSVLYEWILAGAPGVEDQGELARIVVGNDTTHRAAYSYRGLPLAPARRDEQLAILRNARVVKGAEEAQAALEESFPEYREKP